MRTPISPISIVSALRNLSERRRGLDYVDTMTELFPPTEEQAAILSAAQSSTSSLMISALAGTGKTSTLVMLAPLLSTRSVLALAFNRKNVDDLSKVLPPHFLVKSMNSLGHGAFSSALGRRITLDSSKISKLVTAYSKSLGGLSDDEWSSLRNTVTRARISGLVPGKFPQSRKSLLSDDSYGWESICDSLSLELTEELMLSAREVLCQSIDLALQGTIDYDDQIYMSTLFSGLYPRMHTIIVDESQDLSPLNHMQIRKCNPQRIICVGDPRQAIYAFRGADSSSMEKIRGLKENWINLSLTLTFRCPKNVVERQWKHAPEFRAHETAPLGIVLDYQQEEHWTISVNHNPNAAAALPSCQPQAILCRNNAPLISLAFKLIKKRIGVNVLGRDFGKALKVLIKKVCGEDESLDVVYCAEKLKEWHEKEVRLARANDKEEKVGRLHDQYESLVAIIESGEVKTLKDVLSWLIELFEEKDGQITLSTGHKAKGMEWHTVLHLDPWRIPSKWARLARDEGDEIPYQQEMNLKYVIETRAKHTLILANLETFE